MQVLDKRNKNSTCKIETYIKMRWEQAQAGVVELYAYLADTQNGGQTSDRQTDSTLGCV